MISHNSDQANHRYDVADFWNAAQNGNLRERVSGEVSMRINAAAARVA